MTIAVRKTYACPTCGESFTKWGLCQSHVKSTAPCREALGEKLRDPEALQELCRVNAGASATEPSALLPPGTGAPALAPAAPPAAGCTIRAAPGLQAPPALDTSLCAPESGGLQSGGASLVLPLPREEPSPQVCESVRKRFRRAVHTGYLTEADLRDLESRFEEVAEYSAAVQSAAADKFMGLGLGQLRWVAEKSAWLLRCLEFCRRMSGDEAASRPKPGVSLVDALAEQALLPEALSQECWDTYAGLQPEMQQGVVAAVKGSILANVDGRLSEHFFNMVRNERAIYRLEDSPAPRVEQLPEQVKWEAIDGTLYHRLLQKMFFRQKTPPEQLLLRELTEVDESALPGQPGSLLFVHLATQEARMQGSAEVLSILHAAAASGLVRICARFIAEGLDVNERTGCQEFTPLHLAAASGEVEVVKLLLRQKADPNSRDGDGHSALHGAVLKAVHLKKAEEGGGGAEIAVTHHSLQLKVCAQLLLSGAENAPESNFVNDEEPQSAESLAEASGLSELRNLIRLHGRLRSLRQRFEISEVAINELCELQFETAMFMILVFERHMSLSLEAAPTEFRALISSDFIKARDKVQRLGNRLARRLHLSKKAVDALVDLPPAAGMHALNTWKIEEVVAHVYAVPEHLNAPPRAPEGGAEATPAAKAGEGGKGAANGAARQSQSDEPKFTGRVRKWDSERGFGFVVQDPREGEDGIKDIFVHRKNIIGSTPQNHLDLLENRRISYRLGEQDGRPRALEATMIDTQGNPLPIHFAGSGDAAGESAGGNDDGLDGLDNDDDCDEERLTRMFLKHLRSREVVELARERRPECESWFRCVGLRRHNPGRRDDSLWKKEIDRRVDIFLDKDVTPLQKRDFDFRVRRFLHEFCIHSGTVTRVSEALYMVETSTAGKRRDEVQNWPAYLATLLRRFDPKLYEVLAERDRRSRVEQRRAREPEPGAAAPADVGSQVGDSVLADVSSLAGVGEASVQDGSEASCGGGGREGEDSGGEGCESASSAGASSSKAGSRSRSSSRASSQGRGGGGGSSTCSEAGEEQRPPPPPPKRGPPPPPPHAPPPPPGQRGGATATGGSPSTGGGSPGSGLFAAAMKAAGAKPGTPSVGGPLARRTFQ